MRKVLFLVGAVVMLAACRPDRREVTVYTTVDQIFAEPVLKQFEKETGIKVNALYDTEEAKSTGILNRLLAEKNHPQCDLFWSGDPVRAVVLKKQGITRPYVFEAARDIPAIYKDPGGHWTGFSARARVIIYHPGKLNGRPAPPSIYDFADTLYRNDITMANPLFGTTTFHVAALFTVLGDEKAKQLLDSWKANGLKLAVSNGDVRQKVASGSVAAGLTDTDDALEAVREGAPVKFLFPDQQTGLGTLIMPNTVSLIKNSPHPTEAQILGEYLLRPETELRLAELCGQMPLHQHLKVPAGVPSIDSIKPMQVDYEQAADKLDRIQSYLKEWIESF